MTSVRHHTEPDALVLTPDGTIHAGDVPALLTTARALVDEGSRTTTLVLDLSLVQAPGLAAIDAVMRLHLLAQRRGRSLGIRHVPPSLERTLRQIGLSEALPLREACGCRVCTEQ